MPGDGSSLICGDADPGEEPAGTPRVDPTRRPAAAPLGLLEIGEAQEGAMSLSVEDHAVGVGFHLGRGDAGEGLRGRVFVVLAAAGGE